MNTCRERSGLKLYLVIASGCLAGAWIAWLLPELALHRGGTAAPSGDLLLVLATAGSALALLLDRLLRWAHNRDGKPPLSASLLPWSAALFPAAAWLLPESYFARTITPFGGIKYLLAASWLLGSALFSAFLLRPLLAERIPHRIAAGWTVLALLASFATASQPPNESDEGDFIAAALAIAHNGSTLLPPIIDPPVLDDFYFEKIPPSWDYYRFMLRHYPENLNVYSLRMAGYPVILAPFVACASRAREPVARWWIAYLPGLAGYFLLLLALTRILLPHGKAGTIALTAFATATPVLYYPTNTQPEIFMAATVAWSLHLLDEYLAGRKGPTAFAAVTTMSMLLHERMAGVAVPLLVLAFFFGRARIRLVIASAVFFLPVAFSYAATFQFRWPHQLPHAYGSSSAHFFQPARWMTAAIAHAFSIRIGIFMHLPPLLALFGLVLRKSAPHPDNTAHRIGMVAFLAYAALIVTYPHTFDSWPHIRYMIPILPLLAPWLADAMKRLLDRSWGLYVLGALIGMQFLLDWAFLAIPQLWRAL